MRFATIAVLLPALTACDFRSGRPAHDRADAAVPIDSGASAADAAVGGEQPDAGALQPDAGELPTCGPDPTPTGPDTPCPAPCETCADGICTVDCGQRNCRNPIDCPDDYECVVLCDGTDACDGTSVVCPPDLACSVICSNGTDACGNFDLMCGAGSCSIECADDTCAGAVVHCGDGACSGSCAGSNPADVQCGSACACTGC